MSMQKRCKSKSMSCGWERGPGLASKGNNTVRPRCWPWIHQTRPPDPRPWGLSHSVGDSPPRPRLPIGCDHSRSGDVSGSPQRLRAPSCLGFPTPTPPLPQNILFPFRHGKEALHDIALKLRTRRDRRTEWSELGGGEGSDQGLPPQTASSHDLGPGPGRGPPATWSTGSEVRVACLSGVHRAYELGSRGGTQIYKYVYIWCLQKYKTMAKAPKAWQPRPKAAPGRKQIR